MRFLITLLTFALLTLISACKPEVVRTHLDDRAISAATHAWESTGKSLENCPTAGFDVVYTQTPEQFERWCGQGATPIAASCLNFAWHKVALRPGQVLEPDGEPVIHEMLHLFVLCENHGLDADADHKRSDVWAAHGDGTIQAQARRLYLAT